MKKNTLLMALVAITAVFAQVHAQAQAPAINADKVLRANYIALRPYFENAYQLCPSVPRGILEAVSFTQTHFRHISNANEAESDLGIPRVYGVTGLTLDGKDYFRDNLKTIAYLSGQSIHNIINDPQSNVLAYAKAFEAKAAHLGISGQRPEDYLPVLIALSELPDGNLQQNFALNSFLYSVLVFLNTEQYRVMCGFPVYSIDLIQVFGKENYSILSSTHVIVSADRVENNKGQKYSRRSLLPKSTKTADYLPALWDQACTGNYSSRNGTPISAITLHTVQGSYAGCISWFNNCSANVSAHYVLRSTDGQVTQMVLEADKAWHVGSENSYTIGYEHEGWVNDPSYYTIAMYNSSADLTKDICNSGYGINPKRCFWGPATSGIYVVNCPKIKGHQNYPNQTHTDPGINWDWNYYYKLVNSARVPVSYTTSTGTFYDTGGSGSNYADNEGELWLIQPSGASSVTLTFSAFSVENNWDYVYIYDGNTVFSPLIGVYTGTNSPGTVVASSGSMLIEFRSDCSTVGSGWVANWTSTTGTTNPVNLAVSMAVCPSNDVTFNWTNSGTGWYIALSTDSLFATYDWKWVSGLTTFTGFNGFEDHISGAPATFLPGTKYFWYIRANGTNYPGPSFITHTCATPIPANMQVIAPNCANQLASFSWANSGSNWVMDISTDSTFASKSSKNIPVLTSTTAPSGFSPAFYFHHNTWYYWRIFNGSTYTSGPAFLSPMCDSIPPTTIVSLNGSWQTADFQVNFTDADDSTGTGIEKGYYQVIDLNGSEWHANPNQGFFADNYDAVIGSDYGIPVGGGTWIIDAGTLRQTDAVPANTNIYTELTQNLSNRYLYHFLLKMNTTSGNRRFGFHFFADSADAENRGNSYFIWFRANSGTGSYQLEFYECYWSGGLNIYDQVLIVPNVMTNSGQWYDVKVIYDRLSGEINVYRDDELLGSWTDSSPLSNGQYISFRTGNCDISFDELKVYRSRFPYADVSVGTDTTDMVRFQNPAPATFACKVKSIVEDFAGNLGTMGVSNINIDWTPPSSPVPVLDGTGADIDTIYSQILEANWGISADINSGITEYDYCVGTNSGDSNIVGWTSNALITSVSNNSVGLIDGQIYYFSVKALNGAGLYSAITTSDGQRYLDLTGIDEAPDELTFTISPNPLHDIALIGFTLNRAQTIIIELTDIKGSLVKTIINKNLDAGNHTLVMDVTNIAAGSYLLKLIAEEKTTIEKVILY